MRAVKKKRETARGGKNVSGNCIHLRKPEMEDRLLERQQREVKEMQSGSKG
jgi:hypothetical protein